MLPFYKPEGNEIGVIKCDAAIESDPSFSNRLGSGEHSFVIELYDFFGNLTTVSGTFIVGQRIHVFADYRLE